MNSVCLVGNITFDPELQHTASGTPRCRFQVACNRRKKTPSGEWEDAADFVYVTAFDRTAENVAKFLRKGNKVGVTGRLNAGTYEKEGKKVAFCDVVALNVEFLTPRSAAVTDQEEDKVPF